MLEQTNVITTSTYIFVLALIWSISPSRDTTNIITICEMNSSGCACLGAVFTRVLTLTSRACAFWRKLWASSRLIIFLSLPSYSEEKHLCVVIFDLTALGCIHESTHPMSCAYDVQNTSSWSSLFCLLLIWPSSSTSLIPSLYSIWSSS